MARGPPDYLSYLLRLWRTRERGPPDWRSPVWRASLQSPQTGERVHFATLDELFAFLREQIGLGRDVENVGPRESVDQEEDLTE
jgi:hypothetical protein